MTKRPTNSAAEEANGDSFSSDQLQDAVRGGTRAVFAAQIASQLVSLLVLAVLYRLVPRDHFGLLGMTMPLVLLARMFAGLGLNVAAVQKPQLSHDEVSRLFWITLALGIAAAALTAACGPLLAAVYQVPELTGLAAGLAPTLILGVLGAQHQALLERKMRIGRLAAARMIALVAGGAAAVAAAAAGWNVWALVAQQYIELAALAAAAWTMEPFRPSWHRGARPVGALLRFGGYYSLSSFMFFIAMNADKMLLGLILGSTKTGQIILGMYTQSFNLMMKPIYMVTTPMTGIMLPALSRTQHDPAHRNRLIGNFYRMSAILLFPCGAGLFVVGRDVFEILGGQPWREAGVMLTALSPAVLVLGLMMISGSVLAAAGRADRLLAASVAFTLLLLQSFAAGAWLGRNFVAGPSGPAIGVSWGFSLVLVVALFVPYLWFCLRSAEASLRSVFAQLRGPLLASGCMGLVVLLVHDWLAGIASIAAPIRLTASVVTGMVVYAVAAHREIGWFVGQLSLLSGKESAR